MSLKGVASILLHALGRTLDMAQLGPPIHVVVVHRGAPAKHEMTHEELNRDSHDDVDCGDFPEGEAKFKNSSKGVLPGFPSADCSVS